jgi:DNA-binding MarR family transcriptional regulator
MKNIDSDKFIEEMETSTKSLMHTMKACISRRVATLPIKISKLQYGIINVIYSIGSEGLTITEISKLMDVEPPTLVKAIDDLEKKKLVVKIRDANDHRRMPILPTEFGKKIHASIASPIRDAMRKVFKKVGPDKSAIFLETLTEITKVYKN